MRQVKLLTGLVGGGYSKDNFIYVEDNPAIAKLFVSYSIPVAYYDNTVGIVIDQFHWNYSLTTQNYLWVFLRELGLPQYIGTKAMKDCIKSNKIMSTDLSSLREYI